jgi:hypothetical protein
MQSWAETLDFVDKKPIRFRKLGLSEAVKRLLRACHQAIDEMCDVRSGHRLRTEILDIVAAGQRHVHFRDALTNLHHVALIGRLFFKRWS